MPRRWRCAPVLAHIFCGHLGECKSPTVDDESGWPDRWWLGKWWHRERNCSQAAAYLKPYMQNAILERIDLGLIAASRIERLAKIHYGSMAISAQRELTQLQRKEN
jgi:hypothetical protein